VRNVTGYAAYVQFSFWNSLISASTGRQTGIRLLMFSSSHILWDIHSLFTSLFTGIIANLSWIIHSCTKKSD